MSDTGRIVRVHYAYTVLHYYQFQMFLNQFMLDVLTFYNKFLKAPNAAFLSTVVWLKTVKARFTTQY